MSNGAYSLVPNALRETGRTIRDIAGTEAQGRIAGGQQKLMGAKMRYGIAKDVREQGLAAEALKYKRDMDTPVASVGDALDVYGITGEQREKFVGSELAKMIDENIKSGTLVLTAGKLVSAVETLRKEKRADEAAKTKRTQAEEDRDLKIKAKLDAAKIAAGGKTATEKRRAKEHLDDLYQKVGEEYTEKFGAVMGGGVVEGAPPEDEWIKDRVALYQRQDFDTRLTEAKDAANKGGYEIEVNRKTGEIRRKKVKTKSKPKPKAKPKPKKAEVSRKKITKKPPKSRWERLGEEKARQKKAFGAIQSGGLSAIASNVKQKHGAMRNWTRGILDK